MEIDPINEEKLELRKQLEKTYKPDEIWDTTQLQEKFRVVGFLAPFCLVERKSDNAKGTVEFNHSPRLYFNFVQDK